MDGEEEAEGGRVRVLVMRKVVKLGRRRKLQRNVRLTNQSAALVPLLVTASDLDFFELFH
jgi:hypothetical protein